jgi:uncharacterized protein with HEPN domain
MDLDELIRVATNFYYDQPYIIIILIAVLLILLYLKPKQFFELMVMLFILGAVFYMLSLIGEATFTGLSQKEKIVHKAPH